MNHSTFSTVAVVSHLVIVILFLLISLKAGWLKLDHRSLFYQKLFWFSILIPFCSFLYYGYFSWRGHTPDLSASGYEVFYNISKLPLLFLAASVPLASIINNIHRTIQTEKQINEAEKKNLSDSYYNHFKHTLELIDKVESKELSYGGRSEKFTLKVNNPVSLYSMIFKDSSSIVGSNNIINENFKKTVEHDWKRINESLDSLWSFMAKEPSIFNIKKAYCILINIYRIESSFESICRFLYLSNFIKINRPIYRIGSFEYSGLFRDPECLTNALEELDNFCSKIFDIISANNPDNLKMQSGPFLKRKAFIYYYRLQPSDERTELYAHNVQLWCKKGRQNGGGDDKPIQNETNQN